MSELLGTTEPRLWTPALGPLNARTSLGADFCDFCDAFGFGLHPYQRWLANHLLELRADGTFRFRTALVLMARQNGKTTFGKLLIAFLMLTGRAQMVLGTAQNLQIAKELWQGTVQFLQDDPELRGEVASVRYANGEQELRLHNGARYRLAATTQNAGRGLSVDLLVMDELRTHEDWTAWGALAKTTTARPNPMTLCLSNAGSDASTVLNALRENALRGADDALGIFEWSAPDGCALDDPGAWAQANPALGFTVSEHAIRSALATDPAPVFRTEVLSQRVTSMNTAISFEPWRQSEDRAGSISRRPGESEDAFEARRKSMRIYAALDVSLDGEHTTLVLGVREGARSRIEVAAAWDSTRDARIELPDLLGRIMPAELIWFPNGPAAVLAADIRRARAFPRGVKPVELRGTDVTAACMGYADAVAAGLVIHPGDDLLDAQTAGAGKRVIQEGWVFARTGASHVDALYAAAGAVFQATKHGEGRAARWAGTVV